MNQTEVVGPKVQGHGSLQIGQFAREGQGEAVKSSNLHSQRQILPLDIGRTDFAVIRYAQDFRDLRPRHARRGIAAWSRVLRGVQLSDGGIRSTVAKETVNGWTIRAPRIGTHLRRTVNALAQILDEAGPPKLTWTRSNARSLFRQSARPILPLP